MNTKHSLPTSCSAMALAASIGLLGAHTYAGACETIPGGDFARGLSGWSIEDGDTFEGVAGASSFVSIVDGDDYVGLGVKSPFDGSTLAIEFSSVAGFPSGTGSATSLVTVSRTATVTDQFLAFTRGGGFEFQFTGESVHTIHWNVTVKGPDGQTASFFEAPLAGPEPGDGCGLGLAVLGTFDTDEPQAMIDLFPVGIELGDLVTVEIHVSSTSIAAVDCQDAITGGLLLFDNFQFCSGASAVGDIDGDSTVGPTDLAILLGNWGPCPLVIDPCLADLDGDLTVGPADLALLLGNWG